MKQHRAWLPLFLCLVAATVAMPPLRVHALETQQPGMGVSPAQLEFNLTPTQPTQVNTIVLTNTYDVNQRMSAEFQAIDETGARLVPNGSLDDMFAKALKLSATDILVPAKGSYTLQVAVDATLLSGGGHYASLVLTQQSNSILPQGYRSAIAVNLFVIKDENIRTNLALTGSTIGNRLFSMPSSGTLTFKNLGNTHVIPRASISIYDKDELVSKAVVNQTSAPLFPNQQASFMGKFQTYKTALFPKKMRSVVMYRIDGSDIQLTSEKTFWYVPVIPLAVAVALGVALFVWRRTLWRTAKNSIRKLFGRKKPLPATPQSASSIEGSVVSAGQTNAPPEQEQHVYESTVATQGDDTELERKVAEMMEPTPEQQPTTPLLTPQQSPQLPSLPQPQPAPTARPIAITFAEEEPIAPLAPKEGIVQTPTPPAKKAKKTTAKKANKSAKTSKKATKKTKSTKTK